MESIPYSDVLRDRLVQHLSISVVLLSEVKRQVSRVPNGEEKENGLEGERAVMIPESIK